VTKVKNVKNVFYINVVSVHCDRYDPSSGLCRRMHSTHTCFVHSRLDYCNVVFAGLTARDLQRLQSVLNAAVWLVSNSSSRCLSCHTLAKASSLVAHQTACAVQALHASPPLSLWISTILSRRTRRPDFHRKQQSWSEFGTVAVHRCAMYSLDTRPLRILHRSASSLEQPYTAHKTYILHGRLLKELEIFPVFLCILSVMFLSVFYVFILLFTAHKTYLLHGRLVKELEIFPVFCHVLGCFVCFVFIFLFGALVMLLSHLRRLNLDLVDWLIDWLINWSLSENLARSNFEVNIIFKKSNCLPCMLVDYLLNNRRLLLTKNLNHHFSRQMGCILRLIYRLGLLSLSSSGSW